jgi:hypothetical protein
MPTALTATPVSHLFKTGIMPLLLLPLAISGPVAPRATAKCTPVVMRVTWAAAQAMPAAGAGRMMRTQLTSATANVVVR